jgi:hypothetical protein
MKELKTESVLQYTSKVRNGEIMSTEWIEEGSTNTAIPTLLCASKTWTLKEQDKSRITTQMKFF